MECHKCKWNDRPPTAEKAAACWSCDLPPDRVAHGGRTFVSMDAGRTAERVARERAGAAPEAALDDLLPRCCQETAARLLAFLGDLGDEDRNLAMRVLRGRSFAETARELGVTRQAVSGRWAAATRRHPELLALRRKGAKRVL